MAEFRYKVLFTNWKVRVGSDGVYYGRGENLKYIARSDMKGVAISYTQAAQTTGLAVGGLMGRAIMKNIGKAPLTLNKDTPIESLPKSQALLTITHGKIGEKQKVSRIPLNMKDPMCLAMLAQATKAFSDIYHGAGPQNLVNKALEISQKMAVIVALVIVFGIAATIIFFTYMQSQTNPHLY